MGEPATILVYVDGEEVWTQQIDSNGYSTLRMKLPARFGRLLTIRFTWSGTGVFGVLPGFIVNPTEPELGPNG
jgi:hypothetical protein